MKGIDPALFTEAATEEVSRNKRPPIPWLSGPCFQKNVRGMHWALLLKFSSKTTLIKWGCCKDETDCRAHGTMAGPGCMLSVGSLQPNVKCLSCSMACQNVTATSDEPHPQPRGRQSGTRGGDTPLQMRTVSCSCSDRPMQGMPFREGTESSSSWASRGWG